jgi:manganese/zinc/iron transport system ATP- binding protein
MGKIMSIKVDHLTVCYGKTSVLKDISFVIPTENLIGIVGPNGAGKTTLLKALLGLITPISGIIQFCGKPVSQIRQTTAYIPQRNGVDWDFPITVLEVVIMGCYGKLGLFKRPKKENREEALHALERVGMASYAKRQIGELSGGQQQRVFIARALLQDADFYFLDEPFSGIDIATEKIIIDLLTSLKDQGKTLFIVHHDLNTVTSYFDWVILLNHSLIGCGPVDQIYKRENIQVAYGTSAFFVLDENKPIGV